MYGIKQYVSKLRGGNTPSHNNESKEDVAEFNFAQDPKAVHTVLTNPILRKRINLVTAQANNL